MAYTVFFREANKIFQAEDFINEQPIAHRKLLQTVARELAEQGTITHQQAGRNAKGDWTILLNDNGDVYSYTLFISGLEISDISIERSNTPEEKLEFVIIDPQGP